MTIVTEIIPIQFIMNTVQSLTDQVDLLPPGEQISILKHLKTKNIEDALISMPTPVTDNDRKFIDRHRNNGKIKRDKIRLTPTTIEVDGLELSRAPLRYDEVRKVSGLKSRDPLFHGVNIYKKNDLAYFTFDAIKKLQNVGYQVPTEEQRQKMANVFGGNYGIFGQLLAYPKAGRRRYYDKREDVGSKAFFRSSTSNGFGAHYVYFGANEKGEKKSDTHGEAYSLVCLKNY